MSNCIIFGATVVTVAQLGQPMPPVEESLQFIDRFKAQSRTVWSLAEYDFDHPHFDTDWRRDRVAFDTSGLTLSLIPHHTGHNRFASGAVRRPDRSGYGRYEADIRPASEPGLVTGFFVYTGAAYGTRHDEIDIEFLGKDTTRMHMATFVDGQLEDHVVDLGFDASHGVHRYGFDWRPDAIVWKVDGRDVFRKTRAESDLPTLPGYMFLNLWAASAKLADWAGIPDPETQAKARFSNASFTPMCGSE